MKRYLMVAALFVAGSLASASATSYLFDFSPSSPGHNVGPTENYSAGGATIQASGWLVAGGATDLYQKYTAGESYETGLGIAADPDHEIPPPYFVQLDVSDLIAKGFDSVSFLLGSLQAGEQANIYGIATSGTLTGATLLTTLVGKPLEQTWTVALGGYQYFGFTGGGATGADPVIESATARVPDGGSVVLMLGTALLAVAGVRRFKAIERVRNRIG